MWLSGKAALLIGNRIGLWMCTVLRQPISNRSHDVVRSLKAKVMTRNHRATPTEISARKLQRRGLQCLTCRIGARRKGKMAAVIVSCICGVTQLQPAPGVPSSTLESYLASLWGGNGVRLWPWVDKERRRYRGGEKGAALC